MKTLLSPTKSFAPAKSIFFPLTFNVVNFTIILILYFSNKKTTLELIDGLLITIWLLSIMYYFWKWTSTGYELQDGVLFYHSGPTNGSVPVNSIRKIETHSRAWGNIHAGLTFRGLMITYNKWDEIFIDPKDQEEFLQELLKLNPEIQIITPQHT